MFMMYQSLCINYMGLNWFDLILEGSWRQRLALDKKDWSLGKRGYCEKSHIFDPYACAHMAKRSYCQKSTLYSGRYLMACWINTVLYCIVLYGHNDIEFSDDIQEHGRYISFVWEANFYHLMMLQFHVCKLCPTKDSLWDSCFCI